MENANINVKLNALSTLAVTVMSDERSSTGLLNMNGFCYNTFTEWVFLIFIFCFRDEFLNDTVLFVLWARFLS